MVCKNCGADFSWQACNLQGKIHVGDGDAFCSTGCAAKEREKRDFLSPQGGAK